MAYCVCSGAKLKCSMGSQGSDLNVLHPANPVYLHGKPMAGITDHKPMLNVKPFGQCRSLANPAVADTTAAANGTLQMMPCVPNTTSPWMGRMADVDILGQQALLDSSKLLCEWNGMIEITDPGQDILTEDDPPLKPKSKPAKYKEKAKDIAESKITKMYWAYWDGERYIELENGISRHYTDLSLHIETEGYKDGDTVDITLKCGGEQSMFGDAKEFDLSGPVYDNKIVFENIFNNYKMAI